VTYWFNSLTYYFNSLPCRFYAFTFLCCGTDDAHLSEINIPVLLTVAKFLLKTSMSLHVQHSDMEQLSPPHVRSSLSGDQADSERTQFSTRVRKHKRSRSLAFVLKMVLVQVILNTPLNDPPRLNVMSYIRWKALLPTSTYMSRTVQCSIKASWQHGKGKYV